MLCYVLLGVNGFGQGVKQERHTAIALDSVEAFFGFQQDSAGPTHRHVGIAPALDIVAKIGCQRKGAFNHIGIAEHLAQSFRQIQFVDGQTLISIPMLGGLHHRYVRVAA